MYNGEHRDSWRTQVVHQVLGLLPTCLPLSVCLSVRLSVCSALRGFYRFWAACYKNGTACDSVSVCPFVQKMKNVRTLFSPGKSTKTVSWCWFIHSSSRSVYLSHPSSLSVYLSHPLSLSVYLSPPHHHCQCIYHTHHHCQCIYHTHYHCLCIYHTHHHCQCIYHTHHHCQCIYHPHHHCQCIYHTPIITVSVSIPSTQHHHCQCITPR